MTDLERAKDILCVNEFHVAKMIYDNYDLYNKTSIYYYDYSSRKLKLYFVEYHGGTNGYTLKVITDHHILKMEYFHYFIDGKETDESNFFDYLKKITKPLPKVKKDKKYTQLKINLEDYL